jgi:heptosyltransferase I
MRPNHASAPEPRPQALIVKTSSLGDLFHAMPAALSLCRGLSADLDWVVNEEYADLLRGFEAIRTVIPFPRRRFRHGAPAFLDALRRTPYDLVVDLQGLQRSALISRFARARRRIGPSFCREGAGVWFREIAGPKNKRRHAVEECLDTIRYLGLPVLDEPLPLAYPAPAPLPGQPFVAVAPASRWPTKNWPPDAAAEALRSILECTGASAVLVGGPAESEVCAEIVARLGRPAVSLAGRTSLVQLAGLLASADLLIAVDSGPVHVAAALGTPVLGLYGITDPARTGPWGYGHRVIRAEGAPSDPRLFRVVNERTLSVMRGICPERVAEEAVAMLSRGRRPPGVCAEERAV